MMDFRSLGRQHNYQLLFSDLVSGDKLLWECNLCHDYRAEKFDSLRKIEPSPCCPCFKPRACIRYINYRYQSYPVSHRDDTTRIKVHKLPFFLFLESRA